jgi:DNA-binding MarR family transcriptional regulator
VEGKPDPTTPPEAALRDEVMRELLALIASVVLYNVEVSRAEGLGASDSQFLSLLGAHGPLTAGQLARLSGLTSGTVTGVIDRLEAAGFVRRERDPGDRRKVLVVPVPEGAARLYEHYRAHGEHTLALLGRRSADELAVVLAFLRELNEADAGALDAGE